MKTWIVITKMTIMTLKFSCRPRNMRSKPTNLLTETSSIWNTMQVLKWGNSSCKVRYQMMSPRQVTKKWTSNHNWISWKITSRIRLTRTLWGTWISHLSLIGRTRHWEKIWPRCPIGSHKTSSTKSKTTTRLSLSRKKLRKASASSLGNRRMQKDWCRWWARNSSRGAISSHR